MVNKDYLSTAKSKTKFAFLLILTIIVMNCKCSFNEKKTYERRIDTDYYRTRTTNLGNKYPQDNIFFNSKKT